MYNHGRNKVNVEISWENLELIIRQTLLVDVTMTDPDDELYQALVTVYRYYGGDLDEQ